MSDSSLRLEIPAPPASPPAGGSIARADAVEPRRHDGGPEGQLDVVIVGGGIHGVHLAARFVGEVGLAPERLQIVDPGPSLLERWRTFTAVTGMVHLRSPGVHNIDVEPFSLIKDAGRRSRRPRGVLFPPYDLPALDFFNQHCLGVIERHGLAARHLRGVAVAIAPQSDHVRVGLADGRRLEARRVVLALGAGDHPARPAWAADRQAVRHVFEPDFHFPDAARGERTLVVGGGITAAQVALRLIDEGRRVTLVRRHPERVKLFDSDPGWLGPKLMPTFRGLRCPDARRRMLTEVRNRGSVTPRVDRSLRAAVSSGWLEVHEADVRELQVSGDGIEVELSDGLRLEGHHLHLATGFDGRRPGGAMLDDLIREHDLTCAGCGYPVVDAWLRWHPRIHVSGPLADLELGPVARNIAGARRAGDRLVEYWKRTHRKEAAAAGLGAAGA